MAKLTDDTLKQLWNDNGYIGKFFISIILTAIFIGLTVLNAYVITLLWSWFVAPIFIFPLINIIQAMGLVFFAGFLSNQLNKPNGNKTDIITIALMSLVKSLFGLAFGGFLLLFL